MEPKSIKLLEGGRYKIITTKKIEKFLRGTELHNEKIFMVNK